MFSTFRQWLRPTNKLSRGNRRRNARRELLRLESLEGRHLLTVGLFEAHFDFGTSSSPVAAGYTPVPESVGYGAHGYGWLSGQVSSRDRAAGSALERDFNFTQHGTFAVDLPNGRYAVEAVFGDLGRYGHDQMGVFLEGGQVDNVSTAGGQVVRRQYEVDVADGQLTLQLQDLGGADANAVIEALDISMLEQSVPGLSINDVPQFEGDTGVQNQVFTVSLSHAVASDVSVSFAVESSTALAPDDFTAQTGVLTIPAGAASGTIVVQIKGDTIIEPNETYLVRLSNPQGAQLVDDLGVGTILNDDAASTLKLTVSPGAFSENAGTSAAAATLTRTGATDTAVQVALSSNDESEATVPAMVEIPIGQSVVTFPVAAQNDTEADGTQTVTLTAMAAEYISASATVNVTDDEQPPFAAHFDFGTSNSPLEANYARVTESTTYNAGQGFGWTAGAIRDHDRGGGTALTRDFNYTTNGTFVVDAPQGRYRVSMILGDLGNYTHDNVGVFLENAHVDTVTTSGGQVVVRNYDLDVLDGQLTVRLTDLGGGDRNAVIEALSVTSIGPLIPTMSINDVPQYEGDTGVQNQVFTVSLSHAVASDVSVSFAVESSTALAPDDFTAQTGLLTIPAGAASGTIVVQIKGDTIIEPNETYLVRLSNPQGAQLVDDLGVGTILNDDAPSTLKLTVSPGAFSENAGTSAAVATLTRTGATDTAVQVALSSNDESEATVPATVEIPIGQSVVTFPVAAQNDSEADGTQTVTLTASAAEYISASAAVDVTDDEQPPFAAHFDFGTSNSPLEANYARVTDSTTYNAGQGFGWTAGAIRDHDRGTGTALTRDFNYTTNGTFVVDAPQGRYRVSMILGDLGNYTHDNVGVFLENAHVDTVTTSGGQVVVRNYDLDVLDGQLTVRLTDLGGGDSNAVIEALSVTSIGPLIPTMSINDVPQYEGDTGVQNQVFTVSLSHAVASDVSVSFAVESSTALAPDDFTAQTGLLTIPAGAASGTIVVQIKGDTIIEPNETYLVRLSNPQGAQLVDDLGVGTILNDDAASTLKLTVSPGAFSENAGTSAAAATLTRTGATDTAVMVALSSNDESEATVPAMVEIPIGQSVVTFPVAAQNDTEADGTQTVTLTAMAAEYTPASATVNVTDDEQPPFAAYFDFGTGTSPLSPNFTPVSEATTYSPALGYGWTSGVVGSRDRGTRSALDRDMNYTTDATFAVNLPNGLYRVDVLLGDRAGYTHDYVGVFLEGQQRDSVTTSGGQIVSRTFEVQVLDGQLTLRLADLGGGDGNCVIEALRIVDTASGPPQSSSPWWPVRDNIPGAVFTESYNANGFLYHDVDSTYQRTTNNIRVLLPANYDPNQVYQVIYVLPVEAGNRTQFGDGLSTVRDLGLQNSRNVIFVAPSFSETPWFVDHVSNSSIWQETFFRTVVVPFIEQQYSTSGLVEDRLLLGFSKSGYGAVSMLLRHPDFFGRAAVWDAPLAMSDPASGWDFLGVLGSRDNFHANFQITNQIATLGHNLQGQAPRIFLLGYSYDFTRQDHATVDALMTQYSVPHVYFPGVYRQHVWASGWIPEVVDQLLSP